jgi:hypothetical protein
MNDNANAEKQLYSTLSTIKKSQGEIEEAINAGEAIMGKISPRPGEKIPEPKDLLTKEEDTRTLLEELGKISSDSRKLTSKLNNLITWMDKTF